MVCSEYVGEVGRCPNDDRVGSEDLFQDVVEGVGTHVAALVLITKQRAAVDAPAEGLTGQVVDLRLDTLRGQLLQHPPDHDGGVALAMWAAVDAQCQHASLLSGP